MAYGLQLESVRYHSLPGNGCANLHGRTSKGPLVPPCCRPGVTQPQALPRDLVLLLLLCNNFCSLPCHLVMCSSRNVLLWVPLSLFWTWSWIDMEVAQKCMNILVAKLYIIAAKIFLTKYSLKKKDQPICLSGKAPSAIFICCEPHRFLWTLPLQAIPEVFLLVS